MTVGELMELLNELGAHHEIYIVVKDKSYEIAPDITMNERSSGFELIGLEP